MTNETAKAQRNHNTLSHRDFYIVARWVEANQETIKGLTHIKAAEVVSAGMGLTVTDNNISAIATALGITIGRVVKVKTTYSKDANKTLALAIVSLFELLGESVPAPLLAIAAR